MTLSPLPREDVEMELDEDEEMEQTNENVWFPQKGEDGVSSFASRMTQWNLCWSS